MKNFKIKKQCSTLLILVMLFQMTFIPSFGEEIDTLTSANETPLVQLEPFNQGATPTLDYVEGEVLVRYKSTYQTNGFNTDSLNNQIGADVIETFDSVSGLQLVSLPEDMSVEEAVAFYEQNSQVAYVEPNYIYQPDSTLVPNDTSFPLLWGANNTGQTIENQAGTSDADMDLPEAWSVSTGSSAVVIAVIDTGVKYDHPDLIDNIWSNSDEIAGDGIDNDLNGKVDDIRGWDFYSNDNDPMDTNSHGTHVSGTIAGVGNNNAGVAGVMWDAQIMPIRFIGPDGGLTTNAISAIQYANANGADVINNSWGGGGYSQALKDAIDASTAVVVCSSGNNSNNNDSSAYYPSGYNSTNIISVAATDNRDLLASFSNYGATTVDVAAPGVSIYSTLSIGDYSDGLTQLSDPMEDMTYWSTAPLNSWELSTTNSGGAGNTKSISNTYEGNNQNDYLKLASPLNFSAITYPMLEFQLKLNTADSGDTLRIAYSLNDATGTGIYYLLDSITGNFDFTTQEVDLSSLAGQPQVWIALILTSDGSGFSGGAYIDNLKIKKATKTLPSYDYKSGTSMAAPQVAGLAGLIKSKNPTLTSAQIKTIILTSVDSLGSLSGKVATSGRVNAQSALSNTPTLVTGVSLAPETLSMTVGGATATLTATVSPADATNTNVTYTSSTPAAATVSAIGVVTAVGAGTTNITVTTDDGGFTDTTLVTVGLPPVTSVSLAPETLALTVGGATANLTATVSPGTANQNVIWSSDHPEIASVTNGVVTAVTPGSATITVTTVDGSFTDTCAVTVTSVPVTGITLNTNALTLTAGGATATLVATVAPTNASNKTLTYSSSASNIASVTQNGVITPLLAGSTTITATTLDGSFTATCTVTVNAEPVTAITLSPTTLNITVDGSNSTIVATVLPNNASDKTVTWSSSAPSIASVVNGVVTPVASGTATITATAVGGLSATCSVTVSAASIPSGGGGGGGGGGGFAPAVPLVETPVSSTVITESGELVQEIAVIANSDGSVSMDQESVDQLLKDAITNKVTSLTLSIESASTTQDDFNIKLPADLFSDAKAIGVDSISFDTAIAKVSMDVNALGTLSKSAKTIELTITELSSTGLTADQLKTVGTSPVYDFNLFVDSQQISKFQGDKPVEITIPYKLQSGENPENIVVYFLNDRGELERLNFSHFNSKTGEITFQTTHFSKYAVMHGKKHTFTDLNEFQWAAESVSALFTRNVISGMSVTHFDPKGILTKGQFVKMLISTLNITSTPPTQSFTDAPTGHWAYAAAHIATTSGIVEAVSETLFGVNQTLTREDMAVLCYRAVIKRNLALKTNVNIKPLTDISSLSEASKQAITSLYSAGIINGEADGIFNPSGVLNRATASTIIYRVYLLQ